MFKTVRYVAASSLIAFIIVATSIVIFTRDTVYNTFTQQEIQRNIALTRSVEYSIWPELTEFIHSVDIENRLFRNSRQLEFHLAVKKQMSNLSIVKLMIIDRTGNVIFSNDLSDLDTDYHTHPLFKEAMIGDVGQDHEKHRFFITYDRILYDSVVMTTYLPIFHNRSSGEIEGVVAIYTDVTEAFEQIRTMQNVVIVTIGLLLGILYIAMLIILKYFANQHNRSHQKQLEAEQEIRKLTQAVQYSPTAVMITNSEGSIEYVNPQFTKETGYTLDEIRGKNPRLLKSDHHSQSFYKKLWDTINSGEIWQDFILNRNKNGELYWELQSIAPIMDSNGAITHFVAVKINTTEQKHAQQVLESSEQRYRTLVEMSPDPILVHIGGKIVYINPAGLRLFGAERIEDMIGTELMSYVHPEHRDFVTGRIKMIHDTGEIAPLSEQRLLKLNGTDLFAEVRGVQTMYENELAVQVVAHDISDRKELEQRKLQLMMERKRHEILKYFIRAASHDFKTPLSTILVSLHLLREQITSPQQIQLMDRLDSQVDKLNKLLDDILRMSALEEVDQAQFTDVNIVDVICLLLKSQKKTIDKKRHIIHFVPEPPLMVHGDLQYLKVAFDNIITNAINYTPDSGTIKIDVSTQRRYAAIRIEDNGIGIPDEHLPRIFERFYRADEARTTALGGMGLGLAISKRIVEIHNGTITVESPVVNGKGTAFTIFLPPGEQR